VNDKTVSGTLAIFIPMSGPDAGLRGIQKLLNDQSKMREISLRGIELGSESIARNKKDDAISNNAEVARPPIDPSNRLPRMPGASE
jgi:hypothetical protein